MGTVAGGDACLGRTRGLTVPGDWGGGGGLGLKSPFNLSGSYRRLQAGFGGVCGCTCADLFTSFVCAERSASAVFWVQRHKLNSTTAVWAERNYSAHYTDSEQASRLPNSLVPNAKLPREVEVFQQNSYRCQLIDLSWRLYTQQKPPNFKVFDLTPSGINPQPYFRFNLFKSHINVCHLLIPPLSVITGCMSLSTPFVGLEQMPNQLSTASFVVTRSGHVRHSGWDNLEWQLYGLVSLPPPDSGCVSLPILASRLEKKIKLTISLNTSSLGRPNKVLNVTTRTAWRCDCLTWSLP